MHSHIESMSWLKAPWQTVHSRLAGDRLPHGLLVSGEAGVGKRKFAEAVAALLVCDQAQSSALQGIAAGSSERAPCGTCKQCELTGAGTHPDIRAYAPEKSRMIKVDQVRALSAFAVASPQVARRKVIIVDRADQLNINAANALLKTLEEPSADVVLLLLQEAGRPILPTLRSRCQSLVIKAPDMESAAQWLTTEVSRLEEKDRPTPEQCLKALELAAYAPRLALDYLTGEFMTQREQALTDFRQFLKGQLTVGETAKSFKVLGHDKILWLMEGWAADLARIQVGGAPRDSDTTDVLGYLAKSAGPWRAHELLDAIRESRTATVYNVSPELEAERLLMLWQALMPRRRKTVAG